MSLELEEALGSRWASGARVGGWGLASARGARRWLEGWDRAEAAPPSPAGDVTPGRRGWRSLEGVPSRLDVERQRRRAETVQTLRRAGYLTRYRWSVGEKDGHAVYTSGPAAGRRVVDPWREARALDGCGARWLVQLRHRAGAISPAPAAVPCGRLHTCPVCAAARSRELAAAVRTVRAAGPQTPAALMTLTHRDAPGESLASADRRLREALRRLARSNAWQLGVGGAFVGHEVTRNQRAGTWHRHAHVVVILAEGQRVDDVRAGLGREWRRITEEVATEAGLEGYGWRPAAGGAGCAPLELSRPQLEALSVRELRALCGGTPSAERWGARVRAASRLRRAELLEQLGAAWALHARVHRERVFSWAPRENSGWWRDLNDDTALYQACKYPTPAARLAPLALAEWLAVARSRRWHEGYGELRGVVRRAAELSGAEPDEAAETITQTAHAPSLDELAPEVGWLSADPVQARAEAALELPPVVAWALSSSWAGDGRLPAAAEAAGMAYWLGADRPERPAAWDEAPDEGERAWLVQERAQAAAAVRAAAGAKRPPALDRRGRPLGSGLRGWRARGLPGQVS